MKSQGGLLFEVEERLPPHCIHPRREKRPLAEDTESADNGPPRSSAQRAVEPAGLTRPPLNPRRRRLRKWTRDKAGKLVLSLQYQVIAMLAEQGFITSHQIIHHEDDHWRASAKQRIRDCRRFGLEIETDEMGDRCLWRIGTASRARARRLVAVADRKGGR